ncbi:MAG: DotA/TraY family protein, partial [Pseudomonadota bacterium]
MMMQPIQLLRTFLYGALTLSPGLLWAASSDGFTPDFFNSYPQDASLYYLGMLFGNVGTVLPNATGPELFGYMFRILNIIVMSFGIIVLTYVSVMSTVHTAQEGQAMGKKFSALWTPLRSAAGMALLVPFPSGYSLVQIMMMWFIVHGANLGNMLWYTVCDYYAAGYSINQPAPQTGINNAQFTQNFFNAAVCTENMNVFGKYGATFSDPSSHATAYAVPNPPGVNSTTAIINFGFPQNPSYANVCGYVEITVPPQYTKLDPAIQATFLSNMQTALLTFYGYLDPPAFEAVTAAGTCSFPDIQNNGSATLNGLIQPIAAEMAIELGKISTGARKTIIEKNRGLGWMYAGSFYSTLSASAPSSFSNPFTLFNALSPNANKSGGSGGAPLPNPTNANYATFSAQATAYWNLSNGQPAQQAVQAFTMPANSTTGGVDFFEQTIGKVMSQASEKIMDRMSEQVPEGGAIADPILSMQTFGKEILNILEIMVLTYLVGAFLFCLILGFAPGINPMPVTITMLSTVLGGIVAFSIALLAAGAIIFAIYIPLIPYMYFTFGVLYWFILSIEAMASAPIIALGLTIPAQEGLGRVAPAVTLVLNLYLRPALMVLGFVAGSRLLIAVFTLFHTTFSATILSIATPGVFSFI